MPYDPNRHHRRSIRLRGYDYAQAGAYFVTICTQGRQCLFGTVVGNVMHHNDAGRMIERWWDELNHKYPTIATDAFVVMPDHIHGIIVIGAGNDANVGDAGDDCVALPRVMQWLKTMTTNAYIRGVNQAGFPPFNTRIWQRGYYEHVIRDDASLDHTRHYIATNSAGLAEDHDDIGTLLARMEMKECRP